MTEKMEEITRLMVTIWTTHEQITGVLAVPCECPDDVDGLWWTLNSPPGFLMLDYVECFVDGCQEDTPEKNRGMIINKQAIIKAVNLG